MNRRRTVSVLLVLLAALAVWLWRHQHEPPSGTDESHRSEGRPSILVYLIDTLRSREIGAYGAEITETPAMDAFAAEGSVFRNARSPSSWTRPAVASLLTGVPPTAHGIEKFRDALSTCGPSQVRLPQLLQSQGYVTAAVVANPQVDAIFGFAPGFDSFQGLYDARTDRRRPAAEEMISTAPTVVDAVKRFIEGVPSDRPFFLYVHTIDPHGPYSPPAPYDSMYDPRRVSGDPLDDAAFKKLRRRMARGKTSPELLARYRGEVSYADAAFGDLISWMEDRGILDETLVVLTADHGEEFAEHGAKGHGKTLYEEVVGIPLILRHPGSLARGRRDENVDLMDLGATLAAVGGGRPPEHWRGRDLRGPLEPQAVVSTSRLRDGNQYQALSRGTLKLIQNELTHTLELYDLSLDPQERRPLDQAQASHGETARVLAKELQEDRQRNATLRERMTDCQASLDEGALPDDIRQRLESLGYIDPSPAEE